MIWTYIKSFLEHARLLIISVSLLFAVGFVPARAVSWDLESDTWVAADALGRTLPGSATCGTPKANKTVGIFYFLWLGEDTHGPIDITKLLAENPTNPSWGAPGVFHHWGEPELGYYMSTDSYVVRKHCQMLVDAGVDVLCFDATNSYTYQNAYTNICNIFEQIRSEGGRTPQICFLVNSSSVQTVQLLYDNLYSKNLYADLWFYWLGKPLMLAPSDGLSTTLLNYFTLRKTWAWSAGLDNWTWLDNYPQVAGYHTAGVPEEISVCAGQHPNSNIGRSYHGGVEPITDQYGLCPTMDQGLCFAEQWSRIGTGSGQVSPPFLFITGWNEWIAQRGVSDGSAWMCGEVVPPGGTFFVDLYSQEYSRDIEPMKDGYTDNYYYQMIGGIRKYKGVTTAAAPGLQKTVTIDGVFGDWSEVQPEYRDTRGDTEHRDSIGYAGANRYINNTGRNDIVRAKVARDTNNIYFYVETDQSTTSYTDPNWMLLLIDSDSSSATGWHGYDYAVNLAVDTPTTTSLWHSVGDWEWNLVSSDISYQLVGNKMEIAVPRSDIGKAGTANVALDFHWVDNCWSPTIPDGDITGFFLNGDSAPNRRFNYHYDSAVVGPPWEFESSLESWTRSSSISSSSFKTASGSLQGTVVGSNPYVNAPAAVGVNADTYYYLRVRMRNSVASANSAELWFKTLANGTYNSSRKVSFPITCDDAYHVYSVKMSGNAEWKGWVYALQLHPTGASSGSFYVDYVRIFPDALPPAGTILINSGAGYVGSTLVTLNISASDGDGVSSIRFSSDNITWGAWETYTTSKSWTLDSGDGAKTVYLQFKDALGEVSPVVSATTVLDTGVPEGAIGINPGTWCTNSADVALLLYSDDECSGVASMRFSNTGVDWTDWEPYSTAKSWTLISAEGEQNVYVQFKDYVENICLPISDSIVFDINPPSAPGTPTDAGAYTNSTSVNFNWSAATDAASGISSYFCEIGTTHGGNDVFSGSVADSLSWTITGAYGKTYYCRVKAIDEVGHEGSWSGNSDGIMVVRNAGLSVSDAKALADTDSVGLDAKAVSAVFGDYFYIEEPSRFAGIMVRPIGGIPAGLVLGSLVDVGGIANTNSDQERWLSATVNVLSGNSSVLPLAMTNRWVGGGDIQGQKGVARASGLNNIGLLVKTTGLVTPVDSTSFTINDGSGAGVKVIVLSGVTVPASGSFVTITGISSSYTANNELSRLILVRDAADLVLVK